MVKTRMHVIDLLFTLTLFCVFAASSMFVTLIGANVYKTTADSITRNFGLRTSVTYVTAKFRQNDTLDSVRIDDIDGVPALVFVQNLGGENYETWIFHYNGTVREVFANPDYDLQLTDGQVIFEVNRFVFEQVNDTLFRLTASDTEGVTVTTTVTPRSQIGMTT